MWIEWKYNDHGHPDFKELEIPDDVVECYGSVEEYICDEGLVPTWSERFFAGRIKWRKIESPKPETISKLIDQYQKQIDWRVEKIKQLKTL